MRIVPRLVWRRSTLAARLGCATGTPPCALATADRLAAPATAHAQHDVARLIEIPRNVGIGVALPLTQQRRPRPSNLPARPSARRAISRRRDACPSTTRLSTSTAAGATNKNFRAGCDFARCTAPAADAHVRDPSYAFTRSISLLLPLGAVPHGRGPFFAFTAGRLLPFVAFAAGRPAGKLLAVCAFHSASRRSTRATVLARGRVVVR